MSHRKLKLEVRNGPISKNIRRPMANCQNVMIVFPERIKNIVNEFDWPSLEICRETHKI